MREVFNIKKEKKELNLLLESLFLKWELEKMTKHCSSLLISCRDFVVLREHRGSSVHLETRRVCAACLCGRLPFLIQVSTWAAWCSGQVAPVGAVPWLPSHVCIPAPP